MADQTDPPTQLDKFKDLARELECDENEEAFDERLEKVAKAPSPMKHPKNEVD